MSLAATLVSLTCKKCRKLNKRAGFLNNPNTSAFILCEECEKKMLEIESKRTKEQDQDFEIWCEKAIKYGLRL